MRALWPSTMPGTPGKPAPAMSYGHASLTGRQCRPTRNHSEGIDWPRCGSLASSEWPLADWAGLMAKALDPPDAIPMLVARPVPSASKRPRPAEPDVAATVGGAITFAL